METMAGSEPLVSLGLPVYNGENYLRQALESLVAQTWQGGRFEQLEIVISDNASTDGTAAICREFAARDPRVRYFRQGKNIGAGPNYNFVFRDPGGDTSNGRPTTTTWTRQRWISACTSWRPTRLRFFAIHAWSMWMVTATSSANSTGVMPGCARRRRASSR
ncbi:MAG: glycosyltransferase [bacterium]|nr:glycosyltransferase [bacterium]